MTARALRTPTSRDGHRVPTAAAAAGTTGPVGTARRNRCRTGSWRTSAASRSRPTRRGLGERDVVEVVGAVLGPVRERVRSRRRRARGERQGDDRGWLRSPSTPSRCAKPRTQQKRYVARSTSPVPRRLPGGCRTNWRTTIGAGKAAAPARSEPEHPQQQRGEAGPATGTSAGTRGSSQACSPQALPGGCRAAPPRRRSATPASSRAAASRPPRRHPSTRTGSRRRSRPRITAGPGAPATWPSGCRPGRT